MKKYAVIAFLWRSFTPEVSLVINEPEFASTPAPGMNQVAGPLGLRSNRY